ncbi:MAG: hypothetical protein ACREF9_18120 [Opitutaceae bacterium]
MHVSVPRGLGRSPLLAPAMLLLAVVLAYHGSVSVPFFFDDGIAITSNPTIRDLRQMGDVVSPPADGGGAMGRPIVNLSLAINYALGGTHVAGYHVFNLSVHAISVLMLFGVLRRTLLHPVLRPRFGGVAATPSTPPRSGGDLAGVGRAAAQHRRDEGRGRGFWARHVLAGVRVHAMRCDRHESRAPVLAPPADH